MRKTIWIIVALIAFISCTRTDHAQVIPENYGGFLTYLNETTIAIEDIHVYSFDDLDKLSSHKHYPSYDILLSSDATYLNAGVQTLIQVFNAGEDFSSNLASSMITKNTTTTESILTLIDLKTWYNKVKLEDDISMGFNEVEIIKDFITRVGTDVSDGTFSVDPESTGPKRDLHLTINLPSETESTITQQSNSSQQIRVEVRKKGETTIDTELTGTLGADKTLKLSLYSGEYDILLWANNTSDNTDYDITDLKKVSLTSYIRKDSREAYSSSFSVTVEESDTPTEKTITLKRSFAKYRIEATDQAEYELMNESESISDLVATIHYKDNNFPNVFDINQDKSITGALSGNYTTNLSDKNIGNDCIFINGDDIASITVTLTIIKSSDGTEITKKDITITYQRDKIAVITGRFLTAGIDGGFDINTGWDEDVDHEFN